MLYIKGAVVGGIHVKGSVDLPSRTLLKVNTKTSTMQSKEIWKDVVGYEGYYMVSNMGRVKSLSRENHYKNGHTRQYKGRMLKIICHSTGYATINLVKNKKSKTHRVHKLVAIAFVPNPNNKPSINHKNCQKMDNRADNLEWCTNLENTRHAIANGLINFRGSANATSKLNESQVIEIKHRLLTGERHADIAIDYRIGKTTIAAISCGQNWSHLKI